MGGKKRLAIKRLIPTFGVALMATLALSAAGAGAAQAAEWQIEGKTFKELGITEETFSSAGGKLEYTWFWGTEPIQWACLKESSTGVLTQPNSFAAKSQTVFKWNECGFTAGFPFQLHCKIEGPIESTVISELIQVKGVLYELFGSSKLPENGYTMKLKLTGCMTEGTWGFSGTYSAKPEPLGTQLGTQPLAFSQKIDEAVGSKIYPAGEPAAIVRINGSVNETLTGKNAGKKWGAK